MFSINGMVQAPDSVSRIPSSAASTNATVAKAKAGHLFSVMGQNANAAVRYLKIYDKATAPTVGTDVPKLTIAIGASGVFSHHLQAPLAFANGIAYAMTTGAADADATAVGAGDILGLNVVFG